MSPIIDALAEQQLLAEQFQAQNRERVVKIEKARIEKAEDLARRSATLNDIRRLRPQPENRERLNGAARRASEKLGFGAIKQIANTAHSIYTLIRTAVVRSWAGLKASAADMSKMLGISKSSFWRGMKSLKELKLIGSTENYEASGAYSDIRTRKVYHQQQVENTYWIAHCAPQRDFKMCLEAEGRTPVEVSKTPSGAVTPPPTEAETSTGSDTTPQCHKDTPTPLLRRGGVTAPDGVLETSTGVRPSAGVEKHASRLITALTGCASGADKGSGASSGPLRVNPSEFFAEIGWGLVE